MEVGLVHELVQALQAHVPAVGLIQHLERVKVSPPSRLQRAYLEPANRR
jgi:hypothetical protein